jgi:TPR repeat protein
MNSFAAFFLSWCLLSSAAHAQDAKPISEESKALIVKAEEGDAEAQATLGVMYETGEGAPKDNEEAMKWFHKAAEQGHVNAQFLLGVIYYRGETAPKDDKKAAGWLRRAADQGSPSAQFLLAQLYFNGHGVPKDLVEAYAWLNLASFNGSSEAQEIKQGLSSNLTELQREQARKRSGKLLKQAADLGHIEAQFLLGFFHLIGEGMTRDPKEAMDWFRKAAEQGSAKAQLNLGLMYYNGEGVPKDLVEAYAWLSLAFANGDHRAQGYKQKLRNDWTEAQLEQAQKRAEKLLQQVEEKIKNAK